MLAVAFLAATLAPTPAAPSRLMGYYPYWGKYQTPSYTAAQVPWNELTHVIHAFLALEPNGKLRVPRGFLEPALIADGKAAGVAVTVSIGGSGGGQALAFSKVAASPSLRAAFTRNVHTFLSTYGYQGVDIDWEVPQKKDKANCIALMQALRAQLPAGQWLVSMAVPSDPRSWGAGLDIPRLAPSVDFFNVMTYDITGPWASYAGHNSPLYQSPNDPGQAGSLATSMDLYTQTYAVSPAQINIGTAFYGYVFPNTSALWQSCGGACHGATQENYGTYIKPLIGAQGWTAYLDPTAGAPYLLHSPGPGFITYDDATSSANKVAYVIGQRGFGGIFTWELSADYDGASQDLLTAMYDELQAERGARLRPPEPSQR